MEIGIQPNMIPMIDIKQISIGDRLFFELGIKIDARNPKYVNNWIKTGYFKEIDDVDEFVKNDNFLSNIEYLKHHNFMIIKK